MGGRAPPDECEWNVFSLQTNNELEAQRVATEFALRKRIRDMERAYDELKWQEQKVNGAQLSTAASRIECKRGPVLHSSTVPGLRAEPRAERFETHQLHLKMHSEHSKSLQRTGAVLQSVSSRALRLSLRVGVFFCFRPWRKLLRWKRTSDAWRKICEGKCRT